jgi:hypothetical protein
MSASTIIVAANAQLLRRLRIRRDPIAPRSQRARRDRLKGEIST